MKMKSLYWNGTILTLNLFFMLFAAIHFGTLDLDNPESYTNGILLILELLFLFLLLLSYLVNLFVFMALLFKKQWKQAGINILTLLISFVLFYIAIALDEPTLLYAT